MRQQNVFKTDKNKPIFHFIIYQSTHLGAKQEVVCIFQIVYSPSRKERKEHVRAINHCSKQSLAELKTVNIAKSSQTCPY